MDELPQGGALPAEPIPVRPLVLNATDTQGRIKEITEHLEQGVQEVFESERYRDYLKAMSRFHNYSLNNTLLIVMQKPDASLVAGYGKWRDEFERHVKSGEKGIKILAPAPYKIKKDVAKTDPDTGQPVIGADGKRCSAQFRDLFHNFIQVLRDSAAFGQNQLFYGFSRTFTNSGAVR